MKEELLLKYKSLREKCKKSELFILEANIDELLNNLNEISETN